MKKLLLLMSSIFVLSAKEIPTSIYDISVTTIKGEKTTLAQYKNKYMLIVNVASKCGFTPQYEGLETLYNIYKNQGVVVLGFPCNQFGNQEPKKEDDILQFCQTSFNVDFPMFSKIEVNGKNEHPLYTFLKNAKGGFLTKDIKWNFTKFLVDPNGKVIRRYGSSTSPIEISKELESLLQH